MTQENDKRSGGLRSHWVVAAVVLVTAAIPICLLGTLEMITLSRLERYVQKQNEEGSRTLAAISANALRNKSITNITQMLADKASSVDGFFRSTERLVLMERGFAERAWNEQGEGSRGKFVRSWEMRREETRPSDARKDPIRGCLVSHAAPVVHRPADVSKAVEESTLPRFGRIAFEIKSILSQDEKLLYAYVGTRDGMLICFPADGSLDPGYDPRTRPWYRKAADADGPVWTRPYEDAGTNVWVITCAAPLRINGKLEAVVALDVRLDAFVQEVLSIETYPTWAVALVDAEGQFITRPNLGERRMDLPKTAGEFFGESAVQRIIRGKEEMFEFRFDGVERLAGAKRIATAGWTMVVAVPSSVVMALSHDIQQDFERIATSVESGVRWGVGTAVERVVIAAVMLAVLAFLMSILIGSLLARRLEALAGMADHVAQGQFDARVPVKGTRELRTLATSFNTMASELVAHTERLAREAAERERIATELQMAREIQSSLIPDRFPALADAEIHAIWQPARETAGDFYDIFELSEGRVGLVVADVSGKGVGAAVFMTMTRALLRSCAQIESAPASVLKTLNDTMVMDEKTGMFVTAVYAVYDPSTGQLAICDAGHIPPLLARRGKCEWLEIQGGLPLATMANDMYRTTELTLTAGDMLFFCTDGVTEAFDANDKVFGFDRLMAVFQRKHASPAKELCDEVLDAVGKWSAGCAQSDDICLLALKRKPLLG